MKHDRAISSESFLLGSKTVTGTAVYGAQHEEIGEVDELIIDTVSGRVRYATISFGGLLGMGKSYYPIPWGSLQWNSKLNGYVTGVTTEQLNAAPAYDPQSLSNRDWETKLHQNYGARGYWERDVT